MPTPESEKSGPEELIVAPSLAEMAKYGGRLLAEYNPGSGQAEEALEYLDTLDKHFDVTRLEINGNPQQNSVDLLQAVKKAKPDAIAVLGGDFTAHTHVNGQFHASALSPEVLDVPTVFLPYGTGNDWALSLNKSKDLIHILENGEIVDYRPPKVTLYSPNGDPITHYPANSVGVGVTADSAREFNSDEVHGHPDFKRPIKKHFLLAHATTKGVVTSKPFIMEDIDEEGNFGREHSVFSRVIVREERFGIHGRTSARITDPYLREAIIRRKYSPVTAGYMATFVLGRVGIRIPTEPVTRANFRVQPKKGRDLYAHFDDTEFLVTPGTIFEVGLAERSARVVTTRRSPDQ